MRRQKAIVFTGYRSKLESVLSAKEAGFAAVLVTEHARPEAAQYFDAVFEVAMNDRGALDQIIDTLKEKYNVKAVVSNYEQYVVQRSYLAERLAVPGCSVYAACCTRNKVLQRYALSVMPENIEYGTVQTYEQAAELFERFGGDVYLKTIAGVKSRFVYHVTNKEALRTAWDEFIATASMLDPDLLNDFKYLDFRFHYPDPRTTALVERAEYGDLISVDSLVDSHRIWHTPSVCDNYIAAKFKREDSFIPFRMIPSRLPKEIWKEAKTVQEAIIRILGLRNCAVHTEFLVTAEGKVKIVETASRMGGYRIPMYKHAYDLYLPDLFIRAVTGQPVKLRKKAIKYVSLLELFPEQEGAFVRIENLAEAEKDTSVLDLKVKAEPGDMLGLARRNHPPAATLYITGDRYQDVFDKSLHYHNILSVIVNSPTERKIN